MKKILLILCLCLVCATEAVAVYSAIDNEDEFSPKLNLRMHYCIPMISTQFTDDGKVVSRILGLKNHICRYGKEYYDKDGNMIKKISCQLTKPERIQFIKAVNTDAAGKAEAKDLFEKFVDNPEVCQTEEFTN